MNRQRPLDLLVKRICHSLPGNRKREPQVSSGGVAETIAIGFQPVGDAAICRLRERASR